MYINIKKIKYYKKIKNNLSLQICFIVNFYLVINDLTIKY